MVRFIIEAELKYWRKLGKIYIPIWLDLLLYKKLDFINLGIDLHSNMVRFIIYNLYENLNINFRFTFQYG